MADRVLQPQEIIAKDSDGRFWLSADLLEVHNQHVVFTRPDGSRALDLVHTFDVFEWRNVLFEVQGWDAARRRWWVEPVGSEFPEKTQDGGKRPWRRAA